MNGTLDLGERRGELLAAIVLVLLSCWILWSRSIPAMLFKSSIERWLGLLLPPEA